MIASPRPHAPASCGRSSLAISREGATCIRRLAARDDRVSVRLVHRLACLLAVCVAAAPIRVLAAPDMAPGAGASVTSDLAVLVWPAQLEGIAGEQAAASMDAALRAGLARAELTVVEAPADAASCREAECRTAAARAGGAGHVVSLEVRAVDRDFDVRVRLTEVATGEARELGEGCSICGLEDASALVESLGARLGPVLRTSLEEAAARRLQEQALREQPRLHVVTSPAGASVAIDGQKVGVTPLVIPGAAGRHVVEIRRARYLTETREVHLTRGTISELEVALRSDGRLPPSARSRALLISGASLLGVGLGGVAVMAAGLARGAAAERDGAARVKELEAQGIGGLELTDALADLRSRGRQGDTMAIAGAVVGGVLLVGGVTLMAVSTSNRARRVALAPWGGPRGAGVTLTGRF